MIKKVNFWAIFVFYLVAILCRYLTNQVGILDGIVNDQLKSILTGIGPALGAVIVFIVFKIKPTMSFKGNYKHLIFPLMLYWLLPIIFISTIIYIKTETIQWLIVFSILIYGLLEEIGWRGFLFQELKKLPLIYNIFIVSTLWFLWHLNFDFTASNLMFYGVLIVGSWGIGKVADSTNSLLAVSAFHSLNNFFPELDSTKGLILVVLISVWIIGLIIRRKQKVRKEILSRN